ncbi:MAG: hypothetical protein AABY85_02825 [Gemmatimonadota bacterium]
MNRQRVVHGLAIGLLLGTSTLSCFGERTSVFEPVGPPSYNKLLTLTVRRVPGGSLSTAVFPTSDSAVVVTLTGLHALSGAFYKVWLADSTAATFRAAAGRVTVTNVDTVQGSTGDSGVTTIDSSTVGTNIAVRGGDGGTSYSVRILQSRLGVNPRAGANHFVLVSIETDSAAATPSTLNPLWLRYRAPGATGSLKFGNFNQDATLAFSFTAAGSGSAGFRSDEVQADLFQLARPPVGYYYRAWLVVLTGTQVTAWTNLGAITAPYPRSATSLDDADVSQSDQVVLPYSIYQARARAFAGDLTLTPGGTPLSPDATGANWYRDFTYFAVTLQPKAGTGIGQTQILRGDLPDILRP